MKQRSANPSGNRPVPPSGDWVIQFGILCCVVTLIVVFAVAVTAS